MLGEAEKRLETFEKMHIQYTLEDNEDFSKEFDEKKQQAKCEVDILKLAQSKNNGSYFSTARQ